ncbi:MAG: DUF3089 domain-containing protein [Clostridia bacterium]|nr:DUF3089 domain-containing protein [Clostridia bacterium]
MDTPTDYANPRNWISQPTGRRLKHAVDAFFVYPTVYRHPDTGSHHLMPIDSPLFRGAARVATYQRDRFLSEDCNIFAPYYRQVGMEVLSMRRSSFDHISKTPYHDVRSAFFYYLENLNGSRPFILAGHSQGSDMLIKLLCHDLKDPELRRRLIAAYLIGYSLTRQELAQFPHVRLAQAADDLGCVITYNTSAPGAAVLPVVLPGAVAVNPLTWSSGPQYAPPQANPGSVFLDAGPFRVSRKHFTGARIDEQTGLLMIDEDAYRRLGRPHTLHSFDIPLFEASLRVNVATRIAAFAARS